MRKSRSGKGEGFVLAVALLSAVLLITAGLFERIELVRIDSENVALTRELDELKNDNRRLRIACASAFDLTETENYAKTVLGMGKPSRGQLIQIEYNGISDKADGDKGSRISIFKP